MSSALCFDHVTVSWGQEAVLQEFSLTLEGPGVCCLLGPSGCGKTTLLRLAAGLLTPAQGQVRGLEGARVSVMFQEDRLLPGYSARRNVEAVLPPGQAARATTLLEQLGLGGELDKRPGELSGGMSRRVALARALAYDGDILLLDEPMIGLDPANREQALALVARHLAERPRLCLWITHDAREMAALARQAVLLQGPPLTVVGRHVWDAPAQPRGEQAREALLGQLDAGYTARLAEQNAVGS